MIFILLCLYCYFTEKTSAEKHTLQYLYTLRSAPEDGPEFEIMTVFDGLIISHCKSPRFVDHSRYDWISQAFTNAEWENRDLFCQEEYFSHKPFKEKIETVINTTKGIIQRERSCTEDDSVVRMSDRWGVNGEDFLTLDPKTLKWISDSPLARSVQSFWNQMKFMIPSLKDFELNQCKPSLMKLKKKKAEYLKLNPSPEVYIFGKSSQDRDTVSLRCYVSHNYISGVRVRLTQNGKVLNKDVHISSPVPNMDGSVQIRLEIKIRINETDRYHCMVDTDNLHITKGWDGRTLNKKPLYQTLVSDESEMHDLSKVWIAFTVLGIAVGLTCMVILAVVVNSLCFIKDYNRRHVSIGAVQVFLQFAQSDEHWEREVELDNFFYPE